MERRAKVLLRVTAPRERLARRQSYWRLIETVIAKAQQFGTAFDQPEQGLVYAAVRVRNGENTKKMIASLTARLSEHVPPGEPILTTDEFAQEDSFSAVMPPIALWPLPLQQRAALLSGDTLLACVFRSDVFDRAFTEAGLAIERTAGAWRLSGPGDAIMFDKLEVAKLRLGIAFNAMSPRELASVCADQMAEAS
jgi:hypothetical protein